VRFDDARFVRDVSFEEATFAGEAVFSAAAFSGGAKFSDATFSDKAVFNAVTFSGGARFCAATFSGDAVFDRAVFQNASVFDKATFSGEAVFDRAAFSAIAAFSDVSFSGPAWFLEATFLVGASFSEATFSGDACFMQAVFRGFTRFDDVRFEKAANFCAIDGRSGFSLAGVTFLAVPDFIQAHFAEAPRLDNSRIQPRRFGRPTLAGIKNYFKGDRDLSARWRALKRLAVQGHDHMHELEFFQNELKTRRWIMDRPWHAVFWFGLFYGWFSGFGRSILRPLIWGAVNALAFAPLYLGAHFDRVEELISASGGTVAQSLGCLAGSGEPWQAALWISARKALLFFGLDSSDKLTQHYACLYGVIPPTTSSKLPSGVYLDVPDSVIALGVAQHIISAVLLFLLLLAIRNHFRIR
jgi:hypothetical protein